MMLDHLEYFPIEFCLYLENPANENVKVKQIIDFDTSEWIALENRNQGMTM